jgi:homoserine O-acetyltransferase
MPPAELSLSAAARHRHLAESFAQGLALDCGTLIAPLEVAFRTAGRLNLARDNAVLVCHALTGDQYVAEAHPVTGKPGWWDALVGPGRVIDTDRFFVICANVLGGCMGSTGPLSPAPDGAPWGERFPAITIRDMVRAQALLVERLGVQKLFAVIGGSMGGMQVLEWAATFPTRVVAAVPIATAAYHSAQNIAFHEVGRQAIFSDPDFHGGRYAGHGVVPARGLSVARMGAHITYLSAEALTRKFGRRRQQGADAETFQVESYLRHQGSSFVQRFDANSYVAITRAMDAFDLAAEHGGSLGQAFLGTRVKFCVVSFTSDWLFPTPQSREIVRALNAAAADVSFVEVASDKGHDAFLLDEPAFHDTLAGFLRGAWERR